MSLFEKIENDIKAALKERDQIKVSTLRMLKSEINNLLLSGDKKELKDEDVLKTLQRQVKQHRDSIEQFEKGKRPDLAEKEKKELDILVSYMPKQFSDEELEKIIKDTVSKLAATSKKEMGKVMKAVMEKVGGKADGKKVSQIVSGILK